MNSPLRPVAGLRPMRARDPLEAGRASSSLELFFDLVFVVAVSIAGAHLHHDLSAGHAWHGVTSFAMVFFAIWWAWMNFTWFATSFDTDDWWYRVLTIFQMAGVMVLAVGIPDAFTHDDFSTIVIGYVIMRLAMCTQWWRASVQSPEHRTTARTYAVGILVMQALWLLVLVVPAVWVAPAFAVLVVGEIAVPVIAERRTRTSWHPHHITDRYGGFTLIVLGEGLLASTNALVQALDPETPGSSGHGPELLAMGALSLIVTATLWWVYFWPPHHEAIGTMRESLRYGYVHYVVFASAAAFSTGVSVEIDRITGLSQLSAVEASFTVTVPIAVFLVSVWWVALRGRARAVDVAVLAAAALVLCDPLVPLPVVWTAGVMVALVVVLVRTPASGSREGCDAPDQGVGRPTDQTP